MSLQWSDVGGLGGVRFTERGSISRTREALEPGILEGLVEPRRLVELRGRRCKGHWPTLNEQPSFSGASPVYQSRPPISIVHSDQVSTNCSDVCSKSQREEPELRWPRKGQKNKKLARKIVASLAVDCPPGWQGKQNWFLDFENLVRVQFWYKFMLIEIDQNLWLVHFERDFIEIVAT